MNLAKIGRALRSLQPAHLLVLRIVLALAVSALDCIDEAMPLCLKLLHAVHRAMDGVLTRHPTRSQQRAAGAIVDPPLDRGGFGVPHLFSSMRRRTRMRHIWGFLGTMDSRSIGG